MCSYFSSSFKKKSSHPFNALFKLFSRKNSKKAIAPTTTAPPIKRNGDKGATADCAGAGGVVEPNEGSGVDSSSASFVEGSIDEFIAAAKKIANVIANNGAIKILKSIYIKADRVQYI
jgi:hypothetical protein